MSTTTRAPRPFTDKRTDTAMQMCEALGLSFWSHAGTLRAFAVDTAARQFVEVRWRAERQRAGAVEIHGYYQGQDMFSASNPMVRPGMFAPRVAVTILAPVERRTAAPDLFTLAD